MMLDGISSSLRKEIRRIALDDRRAGFGLRNHNVIS